jgi:ion channel-forming bestrophin family protein
MITYNPKDWFSLIFKFHKSDTFNVLLPTMLGLSVYTAFLVYLEKEIIQTGYHSTTVLHSLLGFVISIMLVFRTNTAYDRWWEGRKLWGQLVNSTRNLMMKIWVFSDYEPITGNNLRMLITNYVFALKEHLRNSVKWEELEGSDKYPHEMYKQKKHLPNAIAVNIYDEINALYKGNKISGDQLIVLNEELKSLTDITGGCERIKNTPIPFSYSLFLKKFIFAYVITLPLGFIQEFDYWTILIVIFVFYVLASLELIAEEIEDPFGTDSNDLPTDDISARIKANLMEIINK